MNLKNNEILRLNKDIDLQKNEYEFHRDVIDVIGVSGDKSEKALRVIVYSTRRAGELAESIETNKRRLRELMSNQKKT